MNIYSEIETKVSQRMYNTGDYIVGVQGRYYWANKNVSGCLIEGVSSEEIAAVQQMVNENRGGINYNIKRMNYESGSKPN